MAYDRESPGSHISHTYHNQQESADPVLPAVLNLPLSHPQPFLSHHFSMHRFGPGKKIDQQFTYV